MSKDTAYTFTLRSGLTFHDGTTLDAEAVKLNFDRMLNPETGSPRRGELGPVESVKVTGPLSFQITLSRPYAPFLSVLTNRGGMMVSPAAVKQLGADFAYKGVGAGPFKVVRWVKNSELALERFDGYWRKGQPYLDRIALKPMSDETVRLTNTDVFIEQVLVAIGEGAKAALSAYEYLLNQ